MPTVFESQIQKKMNMNFLHLNFRQNAINISQKNCKNHQEIQL